MRYPKLTPERRFECVGILLKKFPQTFFKKAKKPLKIGIFNEVFEKVDTSQISFEELKSLFWWYCSRRDYLHGLLDETHRIDLEGNPVEKISEKDKEGAKIRLRGYARKRREQQKGDHQTDKKKQEVQELK